MRTFILALTLLCTAMAQSQLVAKSVTHNGKFMGFYEFKPSNYASNVTYNYPVIISLHGIGERGNGLTGAEDCGDCLNKVKGAGIPYLINNGATMRFTYQGQPHGFIVLAPQLSASQGVWTADYVEAMMDYAVTNLRINPNKIFVTGFSLGGGGTWTAAATSASISSRIAGIAPVAASPNNGDACLIAHNKVAVWAFHSLDDDAVLPSNTQNAISAINACNPDIIARGRYYPDGAHAIWQNGRAYDTTHNFQYPNMFEWMLGVSRLLPTVNLGPTARAGSDLTLDVPVRDTSIHLSGLTSTDPDDFIAEYAWEKVSGPETFFYREQIGYYPDGLPTSDKPETRLVKKASGELGWLDPGTYTYRLKVKDYRSNQSQDDITITVRLAASGAGNPGVNLGADFTLTTGETSRYVVADGKDWNPGGYIATFEWRMITGPTNATFNYPGGSPYLYATIGNITTNGVYQIELKAINNNGKVGRDTLLITKINGIVLPVNFVYFKGKNLGSKNIVEWGTASEVDNARFELLRSTDGARFSVIGTIAPKTGNGVLEYSFQDLNAPTGTSYYQLKQFDRDGKSTLTKIVTIRNNDNRFYVERFPNPVNDVLNVVVDASVNGSLSVIVADMQGRVIRRQQWNKENTTLRKTIPVQSLSKGLYQLVITFPDGKKDIGTFMKD